MKREIVARSIDGKVNKILLCPNPPAIRKFRQQCINSSNYQQSNSIGHGREDDRCAPAIKCTVHSFRNHVDLIGRQNNYSNCKAIDCQSNQTT